MCNNFANRSILMDWKWNKFDHIIWYAFRVVTAKTAAVAAAAATAFQIEWAILSIILLLQFFTHTPIHINHVSFVLEGTQIWICFFLHRKARKKSHTHRTHTTVGTRTRTHLFAIRSVHSIFIHSVCECECERDICRRFLIFIKSISRSSRDVWCFLFFFLIRFRLRRHSIICSFIECVYLSRSAAAAAAAAAARVKLVHIHTQTQKNTKNTFANNTHANWVR